jgi:Hemerythrin HHE cation binding domain
MPSRPAKKGASRSRRSATTPSQRIGRTRRSMSEPDITSLLERDHRIVKRLLNQLTATTARASRQREELLHKIESELKTHTQIEEEIFYPAFKEASIKADEHFYYEALEEHHMVDVMLPEMKSIDIESEEFNAKVKVLKDLVLHHAQEEEEKKMFTRARRVMNREQLRELGEQMQTRKQELSAGILTRVARTTGAAIGKLVNGGRRRAA